jgi:Arc/MetJ-type ribon-helix-helix transcriptional regulator
MANQLSPENEQYIRATVERGTYRDQRQALDEAVALLRTRDVLRSNVGAGNVQAEQGQLVPAEAVFERLEKRAREIESFARPDKQ